MKHPKTRILLTSLLAAVFTAAFAWIVTMQNRAILLSDASGKETLKLEAVSRTLEDLDTSWEYAEARITERYEVDAVLSALALRNVIEEESGEETALYASGAVIRVDGDTLTAPEGIDEKLGLDASLFEGAKGLFPSPEEAATLVVYSRIGSTPFYYIQWHEDTVLSDWVEETVNFPAILQKAEASYNVYAMLVAGDPAGEDGTRILYRNDLFQDYSGIGEMGLSREILARDAGGSPRTLTVGGTTYQYVVGEVAALDGYVVLMLRQPNVYITALARSGFTISVLILLLAALLITGFSLYSYVRDNVLTLEQEKRYEPSHVRRVAVLYGIIGTVLIALCSMLIYSLNGLYDESAKGKDRLRILEDNLAGYSQRYRTNIDELREIYIDYGSHIAELLNNYPELQTQDVLRDLADSISASTITLYDCEGNETVSSGAFIDLSLGEDSSSATWEFRQLLKGTPYVVREAETDEETGLYEVRLGVRIEDPAHEGRYGAMIIALDPETFSHFLPKGIEQILENLTGQGTGIWIADPETGVIIASSDSALEGRNVTELGLAETDLQGGVIKKTATEEGSWFVTSIALEDPESLKWTDECERAVAYYAVADAVTSRGLAYSALASCVSFIVIYVILVLIILSEYTDDFYDTWKKQGKQRNTSSGGLAALGRYFSSITPERRGLLTMECIAGIYLSQQIPIADHDTLLTHNSVYYYIVSQKWDKGLNLFALAGILMLLGEILLSLILVRLLVSVCSCFVGSKGKTICRLINSFLLYIALFMFLVKLFEFIGFSRAAIITAIGTLGLAVSLGAQNFVSDIIAGLTFVFEGTFHVGDIVNIPMYGNPSGRGTVAEIGLRFIRILDGDGNVITYSNREVKSVINMTQLNSNYACEITIPSDQPVAEIEELLNRELPKTAQADRRILSGPRYMGIIALGKGTVTLLITAQCREEDYSDVKRIVNHAVHEILAGNGFRI